jgi:hypothetical protein
VGQQTEHLALAWCEVGERGRRHVGRESDGRGDSPRDRRAAERLAGCTWLAHRTYAHIGALIVLLLVITLAATIATTEGGVYSPASVRW